MKKSIIAAACICGALAVAQGASAEKKVLKHFSSKKGTMVFYVDGTWKFSGGSAASSGKWKWIDERHVCPVEWTGAKQKKHCKIYYKAK